MMSLCRICCTIFLSWLLAAPVAAADHASIFLYHRFGDSRFPSTNTDLATFEAHLQVLRDDQYHVTTLGEVVDALRAGRALPEKTAVITVDDVYRSFLDGALPLLRRYGYPATLFINTTSVGGDDFPNWDEIAALAAAGFEIGNHSARHDHLLDRLPDETDAAWRQRVRLDLNTAQQAFEKHLGVRPRLFAYPYGEYDASLVALVREIGFDAAFGQQSGVAAAGQDFYVMPRFPMAGPSAEVEQFRAKLVMRPLSLTVLRPDSNRLDRTGNPPVLRFRIESDDVDSQTLACFVNGQVRCRLNRVAGRDGLYEMRSEVPLEGRRNKYTVTAHDGSGRRWYWFSQLWVDPRVRHPGD